VLAVSLPLLSEKQKGKEDEEKEKNRSLARQRGSGYAKGVRAEIP
jgi:hypothetical protein